MNIIRPYYEILSKIEGKEILKNLEFAGRKCYKSEDKITEGSAEKFVKMIVTKGDESVLEHEKISVLFVCDRGVSHELVRHRMASYSQESTRYCNYSKDKFDNEITFIAPEWVDDLDIKIMNLGFFAQCRVDASEWAECLQLCETTYNRLLVAPNNWTPQQARSVLPNALKTEIVVTANITSWRNIFKQRTSKAAHPQMRELMCPLLNELKTIVPIVFDDINN